MKTLIIIVSIILLSYQIDRFFTKDKAVVTIETPQEFQAEELNKVEAFENFVDNLAPDATLDATTEETDASLAVENVITAVNEKAEVNITYTVTSETEAGTASQKFGLKQSARINQHAKMFHSRMKDLNNFMTLSTIQFANNKFDVLSKEDFSTVMHFADELIFDEKLKVSVAGFSDNSGDEVYNEQLSLMRAIHVQNYLVDLGVNENQILVSAFGIESPISNNDTKEGRALNRRVELALIRDLN